MLEHGVSYEQSMTSTEFQQQNTTLVRNGRAIPPNHNPPGLTVIANVSVEVPQQNKGVPPEGCSPTPPPRTPKRVERGYPLVYRRETLTYRCRDKYAHPSSAPLTKGNSRDWKIFQPLSRRLVLEPEPCVKAPCPPEGDIPRPKSQLLQSISRCIRPLRPLPRVVSPSEGGTHVSSSGCAWPGSMGESTAIRRCPTSRPASRVGPR
ncbi:hypothetical protein CRENBAI_022050 [Crenichthys baileyi]|uniref:Uncharacterized protein n=1 Tax=Crenichthys baileyi TaxID=28760 RepID=A0AAV9SK58_9TELE